jgi:hypothetical protein
MAQLFDLKNNTKFAPGIKPQTASADVNGDEVDTLGFSSVTLVGYMDDTASAAGSFKLQESDTSGSGYVDVSDDEVITADGTNDTAAVAADVVTLGYAGTKRYVRAVFTHSSNADVAATVCLGNPYVAPTGANS